MFRKFFASVFVLSFVILAVPAMLLFGLYRTVLNENFYKGPLLDEVYNRGISLLVEEFSARDQQILSKYFTHDELVGIIKRDVPISLFQGFLDDAFSQLNGILDNNGKRKIILKLDSIKEPVNKLIDDLINILFDEKIKPCAKGEYPKMQPMPSCIPKGQAKNYKNQFKREITANLSVIMQQVRPIELDTTPLLQNLQQIKLAEIIIQAFFAALGILCLFIILVLWKPFLRGVRWLGGTFLFVAFEALVIYKAIPILAANLNSSFQNIPQNQADQIYGVLKFAINYYNTQMLYVLITLGLIGSVLIFLGYFFKKQ